MWKNWPEGHIMGDKSPATDHPLKRLWHYAQGHHGKILLASSYSVLNKLFDLAPPILIGMAVDVVVSQEDSILAQLGITSVTAQLVLLALVTLIVWALESLFQYLYEVQWRNLAQTVQHELRSDAYGHVQRLDMAYFEDQSTGGLIMWIPGNLVYLATMTVLFFRWFAEEEKKSRRRL